MHPETVSTVLNAADDFDLVALKDLKTDLGIAVDTDDAYLARAITQASAGIARYCRRTFAVETVQDVTDFNRARFLRDHPRHVDSLRASRFPIISVVSVTEGAMPLVADVDYRVDFANGMFYRLSAPASVATVWRLFPVTIIFTAGYAEIPAELQGAVTSVVRSMQFNRTRDPQLRSENILSGLYAYTLFDPSQLPAGTADQVAEIIESYRIPTV